MIVAIAGNAVENVVGVQLAARNRPDFAISVIVNSSLQVALALTPVIVFASLLFATGMGFQFLNALFVQRVMGYDALGTGLAFVPTPIVIGLVSLFAAARLTGRFGPRPVLLCGLAGR